MAKEIEYTFHYRDGKERGELNVKVDFIPNKRISEFNELMMLVGDITTKWERIGDLQSINAALETEKNDNWKKERDKNREEIKKLSADITSYKSSDILKMRYELIKKILLNNGIADEKYLTFEFWDECIDPAEIMEFLVKAINKDIETKKKVMPVTLK